MPISPAAMDFILLTASAMPFSMSEAAPVSPRCSSIICTAPMAANGLMAFLPVHGGAYPPMGSNMLSGLMFPPAATPKPPCVMAPRSVTMSPNMFSTTIMSNISGLATM